VVGHVEAFRTLTRLTPDSARTLCLRASKHDYGTAIAVTAFDAPDAVETARILAKINGPLRLPRLRKISPKTLTVLIQKGDLYIPPIDTLELIPEPDGSPTEAFVAPEWLEERQKQQRVTQAAE
jgi:hypothetical protein